MRAVIITGGEIRDYEYTKLLIHKNDTIICADSGYDHAIKMNLSPSVLIGDLDSIKGSVKEDLKIIKYPTDKNFTDTELALQYAKEENFENILILGAIGTRFDHTIANILLLTQFTNAIILNENNKVQVGTDITLEEEVGTIVSLIPISKCVGIYTKNLKYQLVNATMEIGHSLGISNVMISSVANITVSSGAMLVVVAND